MRKAILFYLEKVNPFLALFIFLWCFWIYFSPLLIVIMHNKFEWKLLKGLIDGREYYIQMYIVIKGLFCSVMLLLVGEYFKDQFRKGNGK
jgi:hypothetical protein